MITSSIKQLLHRHTHAYVEDYWFSRVRDKLLKHESCCGLIIDNVESRSFFSLILEKLYQFQITSLQMWYVFCINPNLTNLEKKLPCFFRRIYKKVLFQLYCGHSINNTNNNLIDNCSKFRCSSFLLKLFQKKCTNLSRIVDLWTLVQCL